MARRSTCANGATLEGRKNLEYWNEGGEQAVLLRILPKAWAKRVTKEEAKRAKSNHTVKMMLPKQNHGRMVNWVRHNVATDIHHKHSLPLLITVGGDREKAPIWKPDERKIGGHTFRQSILLRMTCDEA